MNLVSSALPCFIRFRKEKGFYLCSARGRRNTYVVTYRKLKELEDDLHKHVHLENNILFPKAKQI